MISEILKGDLFGVEFSASDFEEGLFLFLADTGDSESLFSADFKVWGVKGAEFFVGVKGAEFFVDVEGVATKTSL